jgi:hypothetical protein
VRHRIEGEIVEWRGPAPYHFVFIGGDDAERIGELAREVTYGWGMIPVDAEIGTDISWMTSLWPRLGGYMLPIKDTVRSRAKVDLGDVIEVAITVRPRTRSGR